ncbi:MAG: xylulokinase [Phycisphaerales bacterium]|nr:xylulokinase [Phycisphaerales bacterium]
MTTCVLGLDIGTSGTKALLVEAHAGAVLAATTESYPSSMPRPLWSEQHPDDWWAATVRAIRTVLDDAPGAIDVVAVGLAGQMHGLVALDGDGAVIRPAILWNDQRTGAACDEIHARVGRERMLRLTGNPALPGFTAPKLVWMREHEPDAFAAIRHVLLPKDYVRFRLGDALASDVSDASGTAMLDVAARDWSDAVLDALDLDRARLPRVVESSAVCAHVTTGAAAATGLRAGTPIVGGAGDQAAQAVGVGVVDPGTIAATIGTSGVVFAPSASYRPDPTGGLHAFCHAAPERWHLMGVMLSAGGSLRWLAETLGRCDYDVMLDAASTVRPGAEGAMFAPYLAGERMPHVDPYVRGAFVGLTARHGAAHLVRAVIEGVSFGLAAGLDRLGALGIEATAVRVSGGGAAHASWRRVLADVFDRPLVTVNSVHGAAFGAALLASVGAGVHTDVATAAGALVRVVETIDPGPDAARYRDLRALHDELYPLLAPLSRRLHEATDAG